MKRTIKEALPGVAMLIIMVVIAVTLIDSSLRASWIGKDKADRENKTYWTRQADCEQANPTGCIEIPNDYNPETYKASYSKKSDSVACNSEAECKSKMTTPCPSGKFRVIGQGFKEVYCTKLLRVYTTKALQKAFSDKQKAEQKAQDDAIKRRQTSRTQCLAILKTINAQSGQDALAPNDVKICFEALL